MLRARFAVVVLLLMAACASSDRKIQESLSVALRATDAAQAAFTTFDARRQVAIAETAPTREAAVDALEAYRDKRQIVLSAFTAAYSALASAATVAPLVAEGKYPPGELWRALERAAQATLAAHNALERLRKDP